MALRRSTTVEQIAQAVLAADPLDEPVVSFGVFPGRHPWLSTLAGTGFDADAWFVSLTERSVVFHEVEFFRYRPGKLAYSMPRADARKRLSGVRRRLLLTSFDIVLPLETEPTRLNVRWAWRSELNRFLRELSA
ncbi:hypothetical protein [Kitasatospora camelliae]|uniref:Uncharacterized protein n=1 Tax=Kitasatospora camelliae TaxID=3156397 RepID=A0AAU8K068_9ACTN